MVPCTATGRLQPDPRDRGSLAPGPGDVRDVAQPLGREGQPPGVLGAWGADTRSVLGPRGAEGGDRRPRPHVGSPRINR